MEDLTGRQFGQYQIVAPLGEGGMAAVYKAFQPAMERFVAVKVLPRQMASSDEFVSRFRREARLLAQLQHPHILPVFDYGEADGHPYIVMPFVMSGTLADILHRRRLSLAEVRRIMTQIADALSYAHTRGMIHRDIKPSNVLVDERGNCLLTDFGLARMAEASTKITTSGAVMGTPAYMSPEQGGGSNVDQRSDLYSLGIILYEMVTGRVPYTAETPIAVIFKHIQDPLPSARKFNPELPEAIELVLRKALAKRPEDRYQTAEQFGQALEMAFSESVLGGNVPVERRTAQPVASTETPISPVAALRPEGEELALEEPIQDLFSPPRSKPLRKSTQTSPSPKSRKLYTALILVLIGLVLASMIGLGTSYKLLVTDPPSIEGSYNISNLSTSLSANKSDSINAFSKEQDIYVNFDINFVQDNTPFESRWYRQANILGKQVYFLIDTASYNSKAQDQFLFFKIENPGIGYYRVDIYMFRSLVGTRYFWVQ